MPGQTDAAPEPAELTPPELEAACGACGGRGRDRDESAGGWYYCPWCNGSGLALTEFGEKVMAMVRRHLGAPESNW